MTDTQLKALIGCILIYKIEETVITNVDDSFVYYITEGESKYVDKAYFVNIILPYLKVYLTEEQNSLVSIKQYLEHYDIK